MIDDEWDTLSMLLHKGFKWRQPFDDAQSDVYRVLLDGYEPDQIATALRALVARGQVFGPTPGELVALMNADPSTPTFDEACQLIYGLRGILRARPAGSTWADEGERGRAYLQAARERAATMHPLVGAFVERVGLDRLRMLELEHEDFGERNRKDLEARWDAHCVAMEGRDVALIAAGRRGGGLGRLDPLGALGRRPAVGALPADSDH